MRRASLPAVLVALGLLLSLASRADAEVFLDVYAGYSFTSESDIDTDLDTDAVYDAVGAWVTELPITPEKVLRALAAKAEPAREGKKVVFDAELSVNTVSQGGISFEVPA